MKPLSLLVIAAGIAVSNVAAAPIGVIIVSGPTFDRNSDALRPYRLTNEFRHPAAADPYSGGIVHEVHEMPVAWGPRIQMHPATETGEKHKACGQRKGGKVMNGDVAMARRMRAMMNRLRAALGLPLVEYHQRASLTVADGAERVPGSALRHHQHQHGEHIVFGTPALKKESFDMRLGRALNALSTWEARAVTFVVGVGLGALLRMLIVFVILALRARRVGPNGERRMSRCARRRAARREAEAAILHDDDIPWTPPVDEKKLAATRESMDALFKAANANYEAERALKLANPTAPPAYDGKYSGGLAANAEVEAVKEAAKAGDLMENVDSIFTIDHVDGELIVYWKHVNGEEKSPPATDFHKKNPQKLLAFYESNLKWRPADVDEEEVVENADEQ